MQGSLREKERGCALTNRLNMNLKLIPQLIPQERIGEAFIKILWLTNILKTINPFSVTRATKFVWQKNVWQKPFPSVSDGMKIPIITEED